MIFFNASGVTDDLTPGSMDVTMDIGLAALRAE